VLKRIEDDEDSSNGDGTPPYEMIRCNQRRENQAETCKLSGDIVASNLRLFTETSLSVAGHTDTGIWPIRQNRPTIAAKLVEGA